MAGKVKELRGAIYAKYRSEAEFARSLGWDRQKLSRITNGKREPDIGELAQLASGLDCSIETMVQIFLQNRSPNRQQDRSA